MRPAKPSDSATWLRLRKALWPEGTEAEHEEEIGEYFHGRFPRAPWQVLVAEDDRGEMVGFVELSIRPYAEGCQSARVAYLEGWFVEPGARGRGVGRALIEAAEGWGRSRGCAEFASDSSADNEASAAAHRAVGFVEAGLIRCFHKTL